MHADRANVIETAIAWHIRLAEADDAVWAAFIDWIAAHPDHAEAYDRVAMADRAIATASFPAAMPVAGNDNPAVAAVPAAMPGRRGARPPLRTAPLPPISHAGKGALFTPPERPIFPCPR